MTELAADTLAAMLDVARDLAARDSIAANVIIAQLIVLALLIPCAFAHDLFTTGDGPITDDETGRG